MIIKDLGAVSAYAYAVEKGYTGTEEEFAALMASYATVAEEAAESAESASTSATSASASAQTATIKASEASTSATQAGASATSASQSAQTATAKASEASASASTASTKATEASQSATTAATKASEASQSASDAQTAQTAAEGSATTAQTAAQTATQKAAEAAESARTLTIDTTLTQSGQAADSKAVGDKIAGVKADLNATTGNVAFTTWEDGYIRCGDATVDITDIRTGQYKHQIIDCSGGDVFTISGQSYGAAARLWCFISTDGTNLLAETANATVNDKIITAPSNATKLIINWSYVSYGTPNNIITIYSGKLIKNTVSENTEQIDIMKTYYESGNLFDRSKVHDGYAINISGTEEAYREACSSDYINLKAGTYCYETAPSIYGSNAKYVPIYTQADAFASNVEGTLDGNIVTFTLSADSRIKLKLASATYQQAMLVNGNVYPETYISYIGGVLLSDNVKVPVKNIFPNIAEANPLYGKKVVFDGDSICHGTSVGQSSPYYGWGYAGRIGTANNMVWHNVAQSGATITHGLKFSDNTDRHWISSYIDTIYANYPDADYIILEGGTNDADLLYQDAEKTGVVSQTAFANFDYDTYAGALDYLFYNALNKFPNAKIGFIVAQKMGITSRYDSQFYRRRFFDMAIETCKKWSIPYIDLWDVSGLNPKVPSQYTAGSQTNLYTDGQHLTDLGYNKIAPKIEAWMKTL